MFRYIPFKEELHSDELGFYTSFGINIIDSSNNLIASISDISINESFVSALCDRYTLYQLDPIHFFDVIEDSL